MMKNKHYDLIMAWANGASIEMEDLDGEWLDTGIPQWYPAVSYRVKKEKKPDIVREALILCSIGGTPLMYTEPTFPSIQTNCILTFDGETKELKDCMMKPY